MHDFQDIHDYLSNNLPQIPGFPDDPSAAALTSYLNDTVRLIGDKLWDYRPLLHFLDDKYGQSKLEALQVKSLSEKVLIGIHS